MTDYVRKILDSRVYDVAGQTPLDPMVRLTTADGKLVASADDTPGLLTDAYLAAVIPEDGAYLVEFCDSRFAGAGPASVARHPMPRMSADSRHSR